MGMCALEGCQDCFVVKIVAKRIGRDEYLSYKVKQLQEIFNALKKTRANLDKVEL